MNYDRKLYLLSDVSQIPTVTLKRYLFFPYDVQHNYEIKLIQIKRFIDIITHYFLCLFQFLNKSQTKYINLLKATFEYNINLCFFYRMKKINSEFCRYLSAMKWRRTHKM